MFRPFFPYGGAAGPCRAFSTLLLLLAGRKRPVGSYSHFFWPFLLLSPCESEVDLWPSSYSFLEVCPSSESRRPERGDLPFPGTQISYVGKGRPLSFCLLDSTVLPRFMFWVRSHDPSVSGFESVRLVLPPKG